MKKMMMIAAVALMAATGACRTSEPVAAYANPVEACEGKATKEAQDECMQNIVADVRASVKREAERKPPR
ncbi:MAG: hypothetical protein IPK75_10120 [Acidobacteria bacterium]|jgi:hypothetical protein|nr:hypothetical protein [Acidobacteriota bacterium]